MRSVLIVLLCIAVGMPYGWCVFQLTDSSPESEAFKDQFLGSFGVNPAIEPEISTQDREVYEKVLPLLKDNPKEALSLVETSMQDNSGAALYYLLGNLYYHSGDLLKSKANLEKAVEKFPSFRRAYRTLALIAVREEAFSQAAPLWLKVIALGGTDGQSYGLLGYAYLCKQKYHSALKAYEMALMYNPESQDFRRGQAYCLLNTHQHKNAIAALDELANEYPEEEAYVLMQANAFLTEENHLDALANLVIAESQGQANFESFALLGDIYLNEGLVNQALDAYYKALCSKSGIDYSKALTPLTYLLERNCIEEASRYLGVLKNIKSNPTEQELNLLRYAEAMIDYRQERYDAAQKLLESILASDPLQGEALILQADIQEALGNMEEADYFLQRAITIPSCQIKALIKSGQLLVRQGNLREALVPLEKAQSLKFQKYVEDYIESIKQSVSSLKS